MESEQNASKQHRKRGRPPGSRNKASILSETQTQSAVYRPNLATTSTGLDDEQLAYTLTEEKLSPFSSLLRQILRRNRAEILRVAAELEITENTIYRWMNGSSEPRLHHLRRLPEVLSEHSGNLTYAINRTFKGTLERHSTGIRAIDKEIYSRVLDLVTSTEDDDARFWQVAQAIFEYALLHLDADKHGLAILYAQLMPRYDDGIHSLREIMMRGNPPWPHHLESYAYLGSTTLAGAAVLLQRTQIWDRVEQGTRLRASFDEHEKSTCAHPVMRANKIAGVLIVASTKTGFFRNPQASLSVIEYAQLLGIALLEKLFQPSSSLSLRPMPNVCWQRDKIAHSYINRIIACAHQQTISRLEAEQTIIQEMEAEFEELGHHRLEQQPTYNEILRKAHH